MTTFHVDDGVGNASSAENVYLSVKKLITPKKTALSLDIDGFNPIFLLDYQPQKSLRIFCNVS